jgi:hypothetical protein
MRWLYYIAVVAACIGGIAAVIVSGWDVNLVGFTIAVLVFLAGALIGRWELLWVVAAAWATWMVVAALAGGFDDGDPRGEITADIVIIMLIGLLGAVELVLAAGIGVGRVMRGQADRGPWPPAAR